MTRDHEPLHLDPSYFEAQYDGNEDPWSFDTRWYERRKYALTLAALPDERYERAVEPGCANGALTAMLAERVDEVVAFDLVEDAVERARDRTADLAGVAVHRESFPTWWPEGTGDLVVWSEVAYYLTDAGCRTALRGLRNWLRTDGTLVAVHWTGETNYPRTGHAVAAWLDTVPWLTRTVSLMDEEFELGVWRRP